MSKILGIIGGGQLGMMLTEASKKMPEYISKVIVVDPTKNCPASQVGAEQIIADFKDENAILELATKSDIITYEIESGDSNMLKKIEDKCKINPSPDTLKIIQDKLVQKTFLNKNKIPVSEFIQVDTPEDIRKGIEKFGFPVLLKSRKDAYDGRGNFKINSESEIESALEYFTKKPMMLEKFVNFKMEVSVIAARNTQGEIATYPVVENIHEDNILKVTIAPARISNELIKNAENIARETMKVLQGAGVFGIEMFVTKNNAILINEIAPRVHNSGHHTLQSSETSQFEQHLRAILGLKLGSTKLLHTTIMCNILGASNFEGEYKPVKLENQEKNIFLKMYRKAISKPKRKLGHFNVVDYDNEYEVDQLLKKVDAVKNLIVIEPLG